MIWNRGYERQAIHKISVDLVLAGASGDWCVCFCAGRVRHLMRRDRTYVRLQGRRRVCASLHYQWPGLRRFVVFTRCYGWLMLVSILIGLFAFAGWLAFLILHRSSWRRRTSAGV